MDCDGGAGGLLWLSDHCSWQYEIEAATMCYGGVSNWRWCDEGGGNMRWRGSNDADMLWRFSLVTYACDEGAGMRLYGRLRIRYNNHFIKTSGWHT